MTINLKVNQDKPKGFTVNDIKGGFFLVKGDNVWAVHEDSSSSKIFLIELSNFHVTVVSSKYELKHVFGDWECVKILSPKQVNLNIGFQWKDN
ncbi:hypothetical protein CHCC14809_2274 [Bacillus licheniformis]|mgnify:CR=1 FL=1|jgi:hypothetical protein|uniref:hypothetical protein n=1 Tax=Bacillus TaxID=1386 RepID=UPI0003EDA6B9|nr:MULTISPECIES: hypothetical protein [Bacillus]ARC58794.1 hypothetical protein BaDB11_00125 [Bacillus licheniformis]EWH20238.1 hypothetical protein M769_0122010 [Bacillus haynesii]MBM6849400.1 hypothetical protein [Bacillus licheniformis]MDE1362766.1 hypothetical protein [Bacillus paralicheniformis]MDE1425510.1 hypothetical protein [Bacillus licheniformis]